jgi:glycogen debranching enzyme
MLVTAPVSAAIFATAMRLIIGPQYCPGSLDLYIDARLKLHPDALEKAGNLLLAFEDRLSKSAIASIGEIFDAEAPYTHHGCVAQAWNFSEVVRSLARLATLRKSRKTSKLA